MSRSHRNSNSRRANGGAPRPNTVREQPRHERGTGPERAGRWRERPRIEAETKLTFAAPPITYRAQPNLGHGDDLDRYAEQYPDLEVFSFDDEDEVNPANLDRRGLGEYVGILSSGY